jgi:PAS domain S-box-containing protein
MVKTISIQQILYFFYFLFIIILFFPIPQSVAVEKVTLQLKWTHQFQFAGYYAAIEKGYYKQKDLDVTLIEGKPGTKEVDEVISGRANFGVGMADILLARLKGEPVVILANIFQHSPSVLLTMKESNISSPQDLFGKKIMMFPGYKSVELQAMLANEGIPIDKVTILKPSWNLDDLIEGKVAAMASYISSASYFLQKKNLPYVMISPTSYGIDFYGDNLFTSEQEIKHHPNRVKAFKEASLKGWQYALEHPEEIIDIILLKYTLGRKNLTKKFLINEAAVYQKLILPNFVKIGHINPGRWKHIADTYVKLGMTDKNYSLEGLIYDPVIAKFDWEHWAIKSGIGAIFLAFGLVIFLVFVNRRVNKEIVVRKQTEMELQKSEELFRTVFEQAGGYCMILKPSDSGIPTILDVNEAACKVHGYCRDEMIGRPVADLDDEEGKRLCIERTQLIMSGNPFAIETNHVRKDGSIFPVAVYANIVQFGDKPPLIMTTEFDISDKKKAEAERKSLENRLLQAQKMESIGTLAGGIAHDFNNILSSIIGFTELALGDVEEGTELEDDLQEVKRAGARAKDLVKQILTFARQSDEEMRPIQINVIVKEVLKFIKSSIPASIQINGNINSDSFIMGVPTQVYQILMNLCTNASQAMETKGGILDVSLDDVTIDGTSAILRLKYGDYIKLTVKDSGAGISPQDIGTIFDPYFTTKPMGEGTGMGLAVVHGIVESYGGQIIVDSTINKGSCFSVYLPISKKRKSKRLYEPEVLPSGTERILFIDDEVPIAKMGTRVLGQLGYSVTTSTSSMEALELFKSEPNDFDLVISDMTMPNMTGDVLAAELMTTRSDIPVIIFTGYSKNITEESVKAIGIKALAYKPIVKADLAKIVRKVLDDTKPENQG